MGEKSTEKSADNEIATCEMPQLYGDKRSVGKSVRGRRYDGARDKKVGL